MRRPYHHRKEFSDHISPLKRWLNKQVGRPWNSIWSEICKAVDGRDVIGKHLLDHVKAEVELESHWSWGWFSKPLFVDKKGFLRARKQKKWPKRPEIPSKITQDGRIYRRIGKNWFSVTEVEREIHLESGLTVTHHAEMRTQLSQKHIKRLGLGSLK